MKIKRLTFIGYIFLFLGFSFNTFAKEIKWYTELEEALDMAKEQDKKVFIFYTGNYCPPCQNMKRGLFKMEKVIEHLNKNYVAVEYEVFKKTQTILPRFILITPDLKKEWQWEGTISSQKLLEELGGDLPRQQAKPQAVAHTPPKLSSPLKSKYFIQFGAFNYAKNAQRLHQKLKQQFEGDIAIIRKGQYKVVVMRGFQHYRQASAILTKAKQNGFKGLINTSS